MTFNQLFFLPLALALLIGCDSKVVLRNPHEFKKPDLQQALATESLQDCFDLLKSKKFPEQICEYQDKDLTSVQANEVFNLFETTNFLRDQEIYSRPLTPRLIWSLNRFVLLEADVSLQTRLVDLMRKDCNVYGEDPCLTYKIFAPIESTRDIFLNHLKRSENKKDLSEIFILAFRASNSSTDSRIFKVFAERVSDLPSDQRLILILQSNDRDDLDPQTKEKIFSYIHPGELSLVRHTSRESIEKAISDYKKNAKILWLSDSISEIRQKRPQLLKALGLEKIETDRLLDVYDFVFESILTDRTESKGLKLFGDDEALIESFKLYVKMRLAVEIHRSDLYIVEAVDTNQVSSSDYTKRIYEKLETTRHRWSVLSNKLRDVSLWLSGALVNNKSDAKKFLSGLDSTIRTYSEYPHMMYIAYVQASLGIPWITQEVTPVAAKTTRIETKKLFTNIFFPPRGRMNGAERVTWLKYTNQDEAHHQITIRNSLLYFLSSGVMDLFKLDRDKFFSLIVSSLQEEFIDLPRLRIDNLAKFYEYNSDYKDYTNFCEDFMSGKPVRRVIPFESLRTKLLMSGFAPNVMEPVSFTGGFNVDIGDGGLPFDLTTSFDIHETVTTDIRKMEDLFSLIQTSLVQNGQPESAAVRTSLQSLSQLKKTALQNILRWEKRGACFARILEEERALLKYVIEKEVAYLKQAHQDMQALRHVATPLEAQSIMHKYKKSYLFEPLAQRGVRPLDRITAKGYFYSQFDLLGRIAHYLQSYSPRIQFDVQLPETITKSPSYSLVAKGDGQTNWLYYSSHLSEDNFINEFYRTVQNERYFLSWQDTGTASARLDRYQIYMSNLISMARFIPELSGASLLSEYNKMLKYLQLNETEKKLLLAGSRDSLWNPLQFDGWFVNVKVRESSEADNLDVNVSKDLSGVKKNPVKVSYLSRIYGIFDNMYEEYCEDVLGFDYYVDRLRSVERICDGTAGCANDWETSKKHRLGPYGNALEFYLSLQDVETKELIFPLDKSLVQSTHQRLYADVEMKEKREKEFLSLIQSSYSPDDDFIDISLSLRVSSPALSVRSRTKVDGQRAEFHLKTQNCFDPLRPKNCVYGHQRHRSQAQ